MKIFRVTGLRGQLPRYATSKTSAEMLARAMNAMRPNTAAIEPVELTLTKKEVVQLLNHEMAREALNV